LWQWAVGKGRGIEVLYHEVRKSASESAVTYRALLRKTENALTPSQS